MQPPPQPCQFLEWDSSFFKRRIARLNASRLDETLLAAVLTWCRQQAIDCLYFLADSDDPRSVRLAEANGFQLVEIRIVLERDLRDWDPLARPRAAADVHVRAVQPGDLSILQDIARSSYLDSRFYFDAHFPKEQWQAYYATWVHKSCTGGAPLALAAEKDGQVVGYITGQVDESGKGGIYELTGVNEAARRAGVGQELFRSGLDWYVRAGIEHIQVATQGRNVTTQRMIQRHGFLTRSCQLYYHGWFNQLEQETFA